MTGLGDMRVSCCMGSMGIGLRGNSFEIFGAKMQGTHNLVSKKWKHMKRER
jgi:hypothetical protein